MDTKLLILVRSTIIYLMNNVTRFPFQLTEPLNAHGYSMNGDLIHVKVEFVRYVTDNEKFDCVVKCDGVVSYSVVATLWRDGEPVPPINDSEEYVSCIPSLTEEEIVTLQEGDELVHILTDEPTTIVSVKEAPGCLRLRAETDRTYFNLSVESMVHYGWL